MTNKRKEHKDKSMSYYDIKNKDKDAYINDDKNLNKIRSKNLREFCKFVRDLRQHSSILSIAGKIDYENTQNKEFAKLILESIKKKSNPNRQELEKLEKNLGTSIKWVSKRTLYDYMNAYKFILACEGITNRIILEVLESKEKK